VGKNWFHPNIGQAEAVELLRKIPISGAFLVRSSDNDPDLFTISFRLEMIKDTVFSKIKIFNCLYLLLSKFRTETDIKHCRIKQDGRLFMIGRAQFVSLVALISHYEKNPLYKQVHLRLPVTEEAIRHYEKVIKFSINVNHLSTECHLFVTQNTQAEIAISCSPEDPSNYIDCTALMESMRVLPLKENLNQFIIFQFINRYQ
jgi:hypothetical protein